MATRTVVAMAEVGLTTETCITCGIAFGMPEDFHANLRRNGKTFYCPNGHSMWFGKGEADRLREQLRAAEAQATAAKDQADAARRHAQAETNMRQAAERSAAAFKGQVTQLRNRVARGQCPCCHRTFADVARHMVSQHPEFETAEVEAVGAER